MGGRLASHRNPQPSIHPSLSRRKPLEGEDHPPSRPCMCTTYESDGHCVCSALLRFVPSSRQPSKVCTVRQTAKQNAMMERGITAAGRTTREISRQSLGPSVLGHSEFAPGRSAILCRSCCWCSEALQPRVILSFRSLFHLSSMHPSHPFPPRPPQLMEYNSSISAQENPKQNQAILVKLARP